MKFFLKVRLVSRWWRKGFTAGPAVLNSKLEKKSQDALDTPSSPPLPTTYSSVTVSTIPPSHTQMTKGKDIRMLSLLSDSGCVCPSSSMQQPLLRRMVLRVSLVGTETFEFGIPNPGTSTCSGLQGWEAHGTYLFWDYYSLPSQAGLIQILSVFQNISFSVKFEQTL